MSKGFDDPRHLWPEWRRLIKVRRPAVLFGEQSPDAPAWIGAVRSDLVAMGYAVGCVPVEAACAGADHRRQRLYFVAYSDDVAGRIEFARAGDEGSRPRNEPGRGGESEHVGDAEGDEQRLPGISGRPGGEPPGGPGAGDGLEWVRDSHGRARRAPPGVCGLVDGVRGRLARRGAYDLDYWHHRSDMLKGFGNAVDLRVATEFVRGSIDTLRIAPVEHAN